jgi:hypothetical protein
MALLSRLKRRLMQPTWLVLLLRACWQYGGTTLLLGSLMMEAVQCRQQQQVRHSAVIAAWFVRLVLHVLQSATATSNVQARQAAPGVGIDTSISMVMMEAVQCPQPQQVRHTTCYTVASLLLLLYSHSW